MERSAFLEDPRIRQRMYEQQLLADRNEGGVPSGHPAFEPGFFGGPAGSKGLDIDAANFEMWKRKMAQDGGPGFFGRESAPQSVAVQRMFQAQKARPSDSWFFGGAR